MQYDMQTVDLFQNTLNSIFSPIFNNLITVITAVIIFLIGWLIAFLVKLLLEAILSQIKIKDWFNKAGLGKYIEDFSWEDTFDKIVAEIGFWFVLLVFMMTSLDILNLTTVNKVLQEIIVYLPKAIAGGLIVFLGFLVGELVRKFLKGILHGLRKNTANSVSSFVKWSIIVFTILTALNTWGVDTRIVDTLILGFVLLISLAGGLAFGLGGQDIAKEILENLKKKIS
jgi:small-conductance mechanosensitive channel